MTFSSMASKTTIRRADLREQLIGLAEFAAMLGIRPSTLSERRNTTKPRAEGCLPPVPAPIAELRCGPVWLLGDVEPYAELSALPEHARVIAERACTYRRHGWPIPITWDVPTLSPEALKLLLSRRRDPHDLSDLSDGLRAALSKMLD